MKKPYSVSEKSPSNPLFYKQERDSPSKSICPKLIFQACLLTVADIKNTGRIFFSKYLRGFLVNMLI